MKRGWRVIAGWGCWLLVLAAIQIIFTPDGIELGLIAGAAGGMVAVGLVTLVGERRNLPPRPDGEETFPLPETSVASLAFALGIAIFVAGWEIGQWLMGVGAGVIVFGIGGLVRERRAQRL
jgi:hypothetical protein